MMEKKSEAERIDRLFLIAFVPAFIFMAAAFYVRFTRDDDPLWSELALPLFFGLLGLRAVLRPTLPEAAKATRWVGFLLIFLSVVLAVLAISNSQGAK
jgi:lipopolysaccharide export LptBFGC system permease protein LptF